jgi:hypothetical protein
MVFALIFGAHRAARATAVPFATPPAISTIADVAKSVFAADLDGDGDLDALSASSGDAKIAWYENSGTVPPAWTLRTISNNALNAWSVFAADVDGDGDLDALSASAGDDKIAWYENSGTVPPTWTLRTISTAADGAFSVFAADVDGDGDLDALSASTTDDKIAWYENSGTIPPSWTLRTISTTADGAFAAFAADLDGDGDLDALSASYHDDKIAWYENSGAVPPTWTLRTISITANGAQSVYAADLDGDGDLDALAASYIDDEIAWYENSGTVPPVWTPRTIATTAIGADSVFAADVDVDGDLDVLSASSFDDEIAWYENSGTVPPTWTLRTISTTANGAYSVFAADVDGDGDLDALSASVADDKIAWYRNETIHRSAAFASPLSISTTANFADSVVAADLDGDGDLDALSASFIDSKIAWYENAGTVPPTWALRTISTTAAFATSVFAADVDGDGDLDALSASQFDDKIAWYENSGTVPPGWTPRTISTTADGANSVFAADVDGDGDLDALSASAGDDKVAWYENSGTVPPTWTLRTISTTAYNATSVFAADVDGDGDLDALSASANDDKIAWYENSGTVPPSWTPRTISTTADGATAVFATDVDGDGDLDALSASAGDSKIAWYENSGTVPPTWTLRTISTNAANARSVFAADMDGDGDLDALSASAGDDKIAWYENNGTGPPSWTLRTLSATANFAMSVFAADVDGDGDLDTLSASGYDSRIAWFENRGGQVALPTADSAAARVLQGARDDVFRIDVAHRGRSGDSAVEPAELSLLFEAGPGTPLTSAEANALLTDLHLYRDDGSGVFEPGLDTLVSSETDLSLTAGVQTFVLPDDDANLQVPPGGSQRYFAVLQWAANAAAQSPDNLRVTHLLATAPASRGEDASADISLRLEIALDVASTVVEVNDAPVAVSDGWAVAEDGAIAPVAPGVVGNDTDEENDPHPAILDVGPTHALGFSLAADGSFIYVPMADYSGPDAFTYHSSDGFESGNVATVSIAVTPVADAPLLTVSDASGLVDTALPLAISASLADTDGSETLAAIDVAGVPAGANLSDGVLQGGIWHVQAADLPGLTLTPAPGSDADMTLGVSATATETANGDSDTSFRVLRVAVYQPGEPLYAETFELGNLSRWSATEPPAFRIIGIAPIAPEDTGVAFAYDLAGVRPGVVIAPTAIAMAVDAAGNTLFRAEARRTDVAGPLELRLCRASGAVATHVQADVGSPWQPVAESAQRLALEWRTGRPGAHDGTLALTLDGRLALWLEGRSDIGVPATLIVLGSPPGP